MLEVVNVAPVDARCAVQLIERVYRGCGSRDRCEGPLVVAVLVESGPGIEVAIVVTADHDLVRVWKRAQPVDGSLDLAHGAVVGKIAGMDEEVSVGDVWVFEGVGV